MYIIIPLSLKVILSRSIKTRKTWILIAAYRLASVNSLIKIGDRLKMASLIILKIKYNRTKDYRLSLGV